MPAPTTAATTVDGDTTSEVLGRVRTLGEHDDWEAAAALARGALRPDQCDVRLLVYRLFGDFLQGGLRAFAAVLSTLQGQLDGGYEALRPAERRQQHTDDCLSWLFRQLASRMRFHAAQRDATWSRWLDDALEADLRAACTLELPAGREPEVIVGLTKARTQLRAIIEERLGPRATCLGPFHDIELCLDERLLPVMRQRVRAAAEAAAEAARTPEASSTPLAGGPEVVEQPAPQAASTPPQAAAGSADLPTAAPGDPLAELALESPDLASLMRKLQAFQQLLEAGALLHAAVTAQDIQQLLSSFDPARYFPRLLSAHFKALHQHIDALQPYMMQEGSPAWEAARSFYQTDLEAFVATEPGDPT